MHPHDSDCQINIRRVADLTAHRSPEWYARRRAFLIFTAGIFTGLTLAGWIAGILNP